MSRLEIKEEATALAKALMVEYHQNRIVVVYTDETILLHKPDALDAKMKS